MYPLSSTAKTEYLQDNEELTHQVEDAGLHLVSSTLLQEVCQGRL